MAKFIQYIVLLFVVYLMSLELTTRVFQLSSHTLPEYNLNGNRLTKPDSEGFWTSGGMREVRGHYKINAQGFNSTKDYSVLVEDKICIAIIGDSYIEGYHVDVEQSIGRIIEKEMNNNVLVHEYGKSAGNIVDFSLVFNNWVKGKYDYTFVLLNDEDIKETTPVFMGRGEDIPQKSLIRKVYNELSFFRYLNINHKLSLKVRDFFSFSASSQDNLPVSTKSKLEEPLEELKGTTKPKIRFDNINYEALQSFDSTTTIVYETGRLNTTSLLQRPELSLLQINHTYTPIDFGFDSHWNHNGRRNFALTLKTFIEEKGAFASIK